ncbi:hypothetical protein GJ496_006176 [Pomphorhynchus laevis]|nr:hypothetical protein GJ496_006176 [Pomphorhynchus laevis]
MGRPVNLTVSLSVSSDRVLSSSRIADSNARQVGFNVRANMENLIDLFESGKSPNACRTHTLILLEEDPV